MFFINFISFEFCSNFLLVINWHNRKKHIFKSYSPLIKIFFNTSTFSFTSYCKSYSSFINSIKLKTYPLKSDFPLKSEISFNFGILNLQKYSKEYIY